MGGKDASSVRYIFTKLTPSTRKYFDPRDDAILTHVIDDGHEVEPEYFVPTLPTVLVNGTEGIGTGFSSYIPPFHPDVIRNNVIHALNNEPLEEMVPYFRGFKGRIEKCTTKGTFVAHGCYRVQGKKVIVTELPPAKWTDDFKTYLSKLKEKGDIVDFVDSSTIEDVHVEIVFPGDPNVEVLKLEKTIHVTNMHLFHPDGIKKYGSPEEILLDFVAIRKKFYEARKEHLLKKGEEETIFMEKKADFVRLFIDYFL